MVQNTGVMFVLSGECFDGGLILLSLKLYLWEIIARLVMIVLGWSITS